jgi:tape measure domain-containing protein
MAETIIARLRMDGQRQFSRDAQQASTDVKGIGDAADDASVQGEQMAKRGSTWGPRIKSAAKTAVVGLTAIGTAAAVMGVKQNAAMQTSTVAFKGLLGSQKGAESMMLRLQKFAAKTPFEQKQLIDAAQRWVGVGNSAKSVVPSMRAVGDAVAGVGGAPEDVMGIVTALTQMQNKGKASSEELQQIAERNIPAFKILGKQLGLTGAELTKKLSTGALGANTAVNALLKGMEKNYAGSMAAQSKTFAGLMSTVKDNANIVLGIAFKPLFNFLQKSILPAVGDFLAMLVKAGQAGGVKGMIKALGDMKGGAGIAGVLAAIGHAVEGLANMIMSIDWHLIVSYISNLGPAFSALAASATGGGQLTGLFGALVKIGGPFTAVMGTIINILEKFLGLPGAPQVVGALFALVVAAKAANAATGGLAGAFGKMAGTGFQMANTIASMITQVIAYRTAKILSTGATVADTTAQQANTIAMTESNAINGMGTLQLARYRAAQVASKIATFAASAATKAWAAAQWLLNAAMSANPIGLVIIAVVALGVAFFVLWKKSQTFRRIVTGAFNGVKNAAMAVWGWIKSHWPLLVSIIGGPLGIAVVLVIKHFNQIVNFVKKLPGRIASAASGMWDGVKNAFRSAINWIITAWNNLELKIPKIKIPGAPDIPGFGVGTPNIPLLATGGTIVRGGAALVGERGPELVSLPQAAVVSPLDRSTGAVTIHVPVYLDKRQIAMATGEYNADKAARQGRAT